MTSCSDIIHRYKYSRALLSAETFLADLLSLDKRRPNWPADAVPLIVPVPCTGKTARARV